MSIYIGIDWSQDKHDVAFINAAGAFIARLTIPHQPDGFNKLEAARQQLAVTSAECLLGLEAVRNLLLENPSVKRVLLKSRYSARARRTIPPAHLLL